jgi:hypothetical protein
MPHRLLFLYQRQASPLFTEAPPETITLDKWKPRLPDLIQAKKWSRPTDSYTFFTFFAELPIPMDWLQPIQVPGPRPKPSPGPQSGFAAPLSTTISTLDWLPALSQPLNRSRGLPGDPGGYPPIYPILPPPEVTLDKWYTPIQQPIFRPAPLRSSSITVCLPESTFATVTIITRVSLQFTAPHNRLDFTTTTNDLDYTAPNDKLDYTSDDF